LTVFSALKHPAERCSNLNVHPSAVEAPKCRDTSRPIKALRLSPHDDSLEPDDRRRGKRAQRLHQLLACRDVLLFCHTRAYGRSVKMTRPQVRQRYGVSSTTSGSLPPRHSMRLNPRSTTALLVPSFAMSPGRNPPQRVLVMTSTSSWSPSVSTSIRGLLV